MSLINNPRESLNHTKSNQDFLNRFEGRTSSIGKAGLLSILDKNIQSSYKNSQNDSLGRYALNSKILPSYQNPQIQHRSSTRHYVDIPDHRSSNQSFKTDLPKKSSQQQMGSKKTSIPKLPSINSPRQTKFQVNSSQMYSQRSQNLDKHTAKHLQFLNMFEDRIKNLSNKKHR